MRSLGHFSWTGLPRDFEIVLATVSPAFTLKPSINPELVKPKEKDTFPLGLAQALLFLPLPWVCMSAVITVITELFLCSSLHISLVEVTSS